MAFKIGRPGIILVVTLIGCSLAAVSAAEKTAGKLDEGQLNPTWFREDGKIKFRATGLIDYLWVKSDLVLKGTRLHASQWEPEKLPAERDDEDRKKAREITRLVPSLLVESFEKVLKGDPEVSSSEGEILVVGRFVDISTGQPMGFVPPMSTFDIKFTDKTSGELLVAIHHRVLGYPKPKLKYWFKKLGKQLGNLPALYEKGEVPTE